MAGIVIHFIQEMFASFSGIESDGFGATLQSMMLIEDYLLGEYFPALQDGKIYLEVCQTAFALMVLKCIKKGFTIYILFRDGDAEVSPFNMCVGMIYGMCVCFAFGEIYILLADAAASFCNEIMNLLGVEADFISLITKVIVPFNLFVSLLMGVTLILGVMLLIRMMVLGVQILVMRIGVPFAALGLIDSDGGMFKSYILTLIKAVFTAMLQLIVFSASCKLVTIGNFSASILCIVLLSFALGVPVLFNQFLIPNSGGGIGQKISIAAQVGGLLRRF